MQKKHEKPIFKISDIETTTVDKYNIGALIWTINYIQIYIKRNMYNEIRIFCKIAWHMLQVVVLWFVSGIRHKVPNYMQTIRNIVNQWKQPDEAVRMMNYPYGNSCIWFNGLSYKLLVPTNQRVLNKSGKWKVLLCSLLDLLNSVRFFGTSNMQWYTMCPNEWVTMKSLADFVWLFVFLCQIEIKLMIIIGNDWDDIMSLFLSTYILRSSYFRKIWTLSYF